MRRLDLAGTALVAGFVGLAPSIAQAKPVHTPAGLDVDDACLFTVPTGATIDVQTGEVTHNGATTRTLPLGQCRKSAAAQSSTAANNVSNNLPGSTWNVATWANAVPYNGYSQFSYLNVSFGVPSAPQFGDEGQLIYLFPSLEDSNGSQQIIQPVLQWGNGPAGGGTYWSIASWALFECGSGTCGWVVNTGAVAVNAGDSLDGYMFQYQSSTNCPSCLDAWHINIADSTNGASADVWVSNLPNSWPKFQSAQMGVLENYGVGSCDELPQSGNDSFNINEIDQFGGQSDWFQPINETFFGVFPGNGPNCNYSTANNSTFTELFWATSP